MLMVLHSESPSGSTGTPFDASSLSYRIGLYALIIEGLYFDAIYEKQSYNASFEGTGSRLLTTVTSAVQTEEFTSFLFGLRYNF
jgi:hypothetical protein